MIWVRFCLHMLTMCGRQSHPEQTQIGFAFDSSVVNVVSCWIVATAMVFGDSQPSEKSLQIINVHTKTTTTLVTASKSVVSINPGFWVSSKNHKCHSLCSKREIFKYYHHIFKHHVQPLMHKNLGCRIGRFQEDYKPRTSKGSQWMQFNDVFGWIYLIKIPAAIKSASIDAEYIISATMITYMAARCTTGNRITVKLCHSNVCKFACNSHTNANPIKKKHIQHNVIKQSQHYSILKPKQHTASPSSQLCTPGAYQSDSRIMASIFAFMPIGAPRLNAAANTGRQ